MPTSTRGPYTLFPTCSDEDALTRRRSALTHPMYVGMLSDHAVERYALFLTSPGLSANQVERRTALQRTPEHGLDVSRVTIVTAERTQAIERARSITSPRLSRDRYPTCPRPHLSTRKRRKCCSSGRSSGRLSRPTYLRGARLLRFSCWRLRSLTRIAIFQARGRSTWLICSSAWAMLERTADIAAASRHMLFAEVSDTTGGD